MGWVGVGVGLSRFVVSRRHTPGSLQRSPGPDNRMEAAMDHPLFASPPYRTVPTLPSRTVPWMCNLWDEPVNSLMSEALHERTHPPNEGSDSAT